VTISTISRRHLLAGASALGALGLAGAARPAAAQARSVTFAGWSQDEAASKPVLTEMFDAFRAANPAVRLELIGYPWAQMQQNLILRMRSNQPLDVVQLQERWLPTFAALNNLADVEAVFGKATLEEKIDPGLLRIGRFGGVQWGVPWTAGSIGMVANRKVLGDAGINEIPTTLDGFVAALRAVKRANAESVPYALCTKNNASISPDFQVWLWTFGGRILADDGAVAISSDAARQALTFMVDLMKDNLAARDIDRPDSRRLFAQNRTAFYADAPIARGFARDNSGQGPAFDQYVASAPYPVVRSGANPLSVAWGHMLVMPQLGGRRAAADSDAARLVQHLAFNDDMQIKYFQAVGLFPVTRTALARVRDDAYVSQWASYARFAESDEPSKWPNAADLTTIVGEEVQAALLQQKPPAQAISDMARRLEPRMREVRHG
jgi:multiple sugar transport system substrate-binding protein